MLELKLVEKFEKLQMVPDPKLCRFRSKKRKFAKLTKISSGTIICTSKNKKLEKTYFVCLEIKFW